MQTNPKKLAKNPSCFMLIFQQSRFIAVKKYGGYITQKISLFLKDFAHPVGTIH